MENDNTMLEILASRSFGDCDTAEMVSVHDGDTFLINVPGWPPIVGDRMPVRIWGIDTPELHDTRVEMQALAQKARLRLEEILKSGKIVLKDIRREKYFRMISKVEVDGKCVAETLIAEGLAREYHGEGPKPW